MNKKANLGILVVAITAAAITAGCEEENEFGQFTELNIGIWGSHDIAVHSESVRPAIREEIYKDLFPIEIGEKNQTHEHLVNASAEIEKNLWEYRDNFDYDAKCFFDFATDLQMEHIIMQHGQGDRNSRKNKVIDMYCKNNTTNSDRCWPDYGICKEYSNDSTLAQFEEKIASKLKSSANIDGITKDILEGVNDGDLNKKGMIGLSLLRRALIGEAIENEVNRNKD
jgi:hypothetical protein